MKEWRPRRNLQASKWRHQMLEAVTDVVELLYQRDRTAWFFRLYLWLSCLSQGSYTTISWFDTQHSQRRLEMCLHSWIAVNAPFSQLRRQAELGTWTRSVTLCLNSFMCWRITWWTIWWNIWSPIFVGEIITDLTELNSAIASLSMDVRIWKWKWYPRAGAQAIGTNGTRLLNNKI